MKLPGLQAYLKAKDLSILFLIVLVVPHSKVAMTDLDILERLQDIFGGHIYTKAKQKPHHKQGWTWQITRKADVYATLEKLLPWFGERRSYRALNVLDHLDRI